ncbi:MAG TPA: hypothetical protein VGJ16_11835 [Pirellulales bacterium]|jgi:hypothetical protein
MTTTNSSTPSMSEATAYVARQTDQSIARVLERARERAAWLTGELNRTVGQVQRLEAELLDSNKRM